MTVGMKSNHKEFVMNGIKDESVFQLRHLYVSPLLLIFFPRHMVNAYLNTIKRELFHRPLQTLRGLASRCSHKEVMFNYKHRFKKINISYFTSNLLCFFRGQLRIL